MWIFSFLLVLLMAFKVEVGQFTKETSGTANATQTVTLVDAALTPKALILWCSGQTATGFAADALFSLGFGTGTALANQVAKAAFSGDNLATSNCSRSIRDAVLIVLAASEAVLVLGRINALSAGSFQLIYPTNNTSAYIIHYMVLGGDDLTNAAVLRFAAPTVVGNRDDTGFGFQPDCVLFLNGGQAESTLGQRAGHSTGCLGAAISSTKLWTMAMTGLDAATMTANLGAVSSQRSDACWLALTQASAPNTDGRSGFVGFVADGYTLDWADAPATAVLYGALALKGGQYAVDVFDKSTGAAPATQDVTTVGFDPVGFLLASRDQIAGTGVDGNAEFAVGGSDGTREGSQWTNWDDNVLNTEADHRILNANVLSLSRSDAAGGVEESLADHTVDLSNGFRLVWNPNEAVAKQICYVAFGDAAVVTISPAGIASVEAFGTAKEILTLPIVGGLASAEEFGTAKQILALLGVGSIISGETFGSHRQTFLVNGLTGIPSGEVFGLGALVFIIRPDGLPSGETFGSVAVQGGQAVPKGSYICSFAHRRR